MIGSDYDLSIVRRQANIRTNAGLEFAELLELHVISLIFQSKHNDSD